MLMKWEHWEYHFQSEQNFEKEPTDAGVWWHTSLIPAIGKLRQEGHNFKANLGYIMRTCLKRKKKNP
jgi:hypothetical protein